jgi:hypothetical protein
MLIKYLKSKNRPKISEPKKPVANWSFADVVYYISRQDKEKVSTKDIIEHFGMSPAEAAQTISRLYAEGFLPLENQTLKLDQYIIEKEIENHKLESAKKLFKEIDKNSHTTRLKCPKCKTSDYVTTTVAGMRDGWYYADEDGWPAKSGLGEDGRYSTGCVIIPKLLMYGNICMQCEVRFADDGSFLTKEERENISWMD